MRELERRVVLSVLDRKWREHLYEMDYLREGIGLRAMAQRDPLVEYQREGYDMFASMMESIKEESVGFIFNVEVDVEAMRAEMELANEAALADDDRLEGRSIRGHPLLGRGGCRARRRGRRRRAAAGHPAAAGHAAPAGEGPDQRAPSAAADVLGADDRR